MIIIFLNKKYFIVTINIAKKILPVVIVYLYCFIFFQYSVYEKTTTKP